MKRPGEKNLVVFINSSSVDISCDYQKMSMKILTSVIFILVSLDSNSQDIAIARKIVDTLTSPTFWGRGYTKNGMQKAAGFLAEQFKMYGVAPIADDSYLQPFNYSVNTFP